MTLGFTNSPHNKKEEDGRSPPPFTDYIHSFSSGGFVKSLPLSIRRSCHASHIRGEAFLLIPGVLSHKIRCQSVLEITKSLRHSVLHRALIL